MDVLREHLSRSLMGGQAFVSFKKALESINPDYRNIRPNSKIHSIYEELEHIRIAQQDLLYYALLDEWDSPDWPEGFWPNPETEVTDSIWEKTVNGFFEDLEKAVKLVEDSNVDLMSLIPRSEYTYLREITIIIEHNAYHLGKIVDIRKSLGDWTR